MPDVRIRGGGVAACCATRLLRRAGWGVDWEDSDRPRLPAILLGTAARKLIADIFGEKDFFAGCHRINKRVVAWGGRETVTVDHSAVVVSEEQLLDRLRPGSGDAPGTDAPWTIYTCRPPQSSEHGFGSRIASAIPVEIRGDAEACAIESLNAGWLFLIPNAPQSGWLLAVGGPPDELLAESRVITERIARLGDSAGAFPAYPRIAIPLAAPGRLACGTAAMAFDPICGDGTGNAIREAILASAVIGAALKGAGTSSLLSHYESRLKLGFERHLMLCRDFYRSGGRGSWWAGELEALDRGIEWCANRAAPRFEYQLDGFELRPVI